MRTRRARWVAIPDDRFEVGQRNLFTTADECMHVFRTTARSTARSCSTVYARRTPRLHTSAAENQSFAASSISGTPMR